jgi:transcriptional regulator with XRE-family HTH domain
MDYWEFGRRVQQIREVLLKMTQVEVARELQVAQAVISRVERGENISLKFVLEFMDLLKRKNLVAYRLFREPFELELLLGDKPTPKIDERAFELIKKLKDHAKEDLENMIVLMEIMKQKGK